MSAEDFDVDAAAKEHHDRLMFHDMSLEDRALLVRWLTGPGARPTGDDVRRWAAATREGRFPRRTAHPCPDHPGETAHNCRCCAADRKAVGE